MYEDKTLVCKDCGNEFVFTAGEQEFYAEKGFQNDLQDAKIAAWHVKKLLKLQEKCTLLYAQIAAERLRFHSNQRMTVQSIAVNASQS